MDENEFIRKIVNKEFNENPKFEQIALTQKQKDEIVVELNTNAVKYRDKDSGKDNRL